MKLSALPHLIQEGENQLAVKGICSFDIAGSVFGLILKSGFKKYDLPDLLEVNGVF
ncbi:hypothetical protein Nepgr_016960 [Nepenthes gracilis]|uniref:Uncharacterized protein n=1 Tax=Nepenthes gracilis TaxID=150966 RepID=A0AAD3XSM6_NEPGR|nr:hypothetical protein Nepgr_016960 [Nepenthes gracilis]